MNWMVKLDSGKEFVINNAPDMEEALASADQVIHDWYPDAVITSFEPDERKACAGCAVICGTILVIAAALTLLAAHAIFFGPDCSDLPQGFIGFCRF